MHHQTLCLPACGSLHSTARSEWPLDGAFYKRWQSQAIGQANLMFLLSHPSEGENKCFKVNEKQESIMEREKNKARHINLKH